MVKRLVLTLLFAFTSIPTVANPPSQRVVLGVLEDVPGKYVGEPDSRRVRIVFEKYGDRWRPFRSDCPTQDCLKTIAREYPAEVAWTIAFDGKNLGTVTGRTPKVFDFYSDVGLQDITSMGTIPTVGKKSAEYGGFHGDAVDRPLIANSQPYFKDPEEWRPTRLSKELVSALHEQFRKAFPKVKNCASAEDAPKPWRYQEQDIEIAKAYSSKGNWSIAQLRLKESRCDYSDYPEFTGQWFVIDPDRKISALGQEMWLVDAGDYDNDGKSELVFALDGDNKGGYVLYYDDFKKHISFVFGYH